MGRKMVRTLTLPVAVALAIVDAFEVADAVQALASYLAGMF